MGSDLKPLGKRADEPMRLPRRESRASVYKAVDLLSRRPSLFCTKKRRQPAAIHRL